MISWLQTNLQKHFRTVFIVLLVVIIVAFVFTIGNQGSLGGADQEEAAKRSFFEVSLNTRAKLDRFLQQDPRIAAILTGSRQMPDPFYRAAALHVANEHTIPEPSDKELTDYIRSLPIFQDRAGGFNAQSYSMMLDNLKLAGIATESDMLRVLRDQYRIDKVREALAGPGAVDKAEILESLKDRSTKWSVLVATYDLKQYTPEIEATPEQLKAFFEERKASYMTPARRTIDYVEFDASRFVDQVKPTDEELTRYFENNYSRYQPKPEEPAEGEEPKPVEPVTFEQARSQVRQDYIQDKARDLALERANDLIIELINAEAANNSETYQAMLKQFGVEEKNAPSFAADERPIGTTWPREQVRQAFLLSPEKYYAEPFMSGDRAVVMFYDSEIEPVLPQFETVLAAVESDYRAEELAKRRQERSVELQNQLKEAGASEEAFGAAAEMAGMSTKKYEGFTPMQPAADMDPALISPLENLEVGEVSRAVRTRAPDEIAFVYALSKEAPEVSEDSEEYKQMAGYLTEFFSNRVADSYLQKLVEAEQERTQIRL